MSAADGTGQVPPLLSPTPLGSPACSPLAVLVEATPCIPRRCVVFHFSLELLRCLLVGVEHRRPVLFSSRSKGEWKSWKCSDVVNGARRARIEHICLGERPMGGLQLANELEITSMHPSFGMEYKCPSLEWKELMKGPSQTAVLAHLRKVLHYRCFFNAGGTWRRPAALP